MVTMAADKERSRKSGRGQTLKEKRLAQHMFQMRMLMAITILCCLATLIWLIALSTDYWILVTASPTGKQPFVHSNAGVWKICFHQTVNGTNTTQATCSFHNLDPESMELRSDPSVADTIIDYRRSVMALAVLSMLVMSMGVAFSFYTFFNPRYTFKRLAAGMHFLTASMAMVLIQVVLGGAQYGRSKLPSRHPPGSTWTYGFSFYLACSVFSIFATAFIVFLAYSKKKKGDNAISEELALADEHVAMGR